jgi:hypothetical protein
MVGGSMVSRSTSPKVGTESDPLNQLRKEVSLIIYSFLKLGELCCKARERSLY